MRTAHMCLLLSGAFVCASAQTGKLGTPVSGFVYDESVKAIRAIRGIPGAAVMGEPVESAAALNAATVSSNGRIALAYGRGGLRLLRLDTGGTTPIRGAMPEAARIIFSPSGASAALAGSGIQIVTGLPDNPAAGPVVADEPSGGAVAVSDDGLALVSASGGPEDPVWLIADGVARQAAAPGSIVAAAFRANSTDAAAVTKDGEIYVIENARSAAVARQVFAVDSRTAAAVAIYFATDGRRVYTANASGTIAILDLPTGALTTMSCGCVPSTFEHLSGAFFRLTRVSDGPMWLLDASGITPRVWFVPPDRAGERGARRRQ